MAYSFRGFRHGHLFLSYGELEHHGGVHVMKPSGQERRREEKKGRERRSGRERRTLEEGARDQL